LVKGQLQIDAGAESALQKRRSLLAVGVKSIVGDFEQGEVFEILDEKQNTIAVAKAKISSAFLKDNLKTQNLEVANANDIVLI
jgi:glutamate 5-kinase